MCKGVIFESFHVFSHMIHIEGSIQINITHILTYFMNIAFFYVFYCYTKKFPSNEFIIYMCILIILDIYTFYNYPSIYPHFPYHILIETIGIVLFYVICSNFYKL